MKQLEKRIGEQGTQWRKPPSPSQEEVMFPGIKPLAEPMESANRFFTVLFRSVVPQRPRLLNGRLPDYLWPFAFHMLRLLVFFDLFANLHY